MEEIMERERSRSRFFFLVGGLKKKDRSQKIILPNISSKAQKKNFFRIRNFLLRNLILSSG